MAENLFQLQEGVKSFGSRELFSKATFSINSMEHVGVIGPNGAGKSTLFRILTGEESLDSGQVIRSRKLSVGYLSQHDHWREKETGNEYLENTTKIPLWQLKSQGRILQLTEEIFEKPVLSLSGGYRMRIKLLGLLGQEPNLMLLDEPTNYLDLETTLVLERFLQSYDGAFLLISHDREFLRLTTDHILEVEGGEITKFNGNIDDYFEQKSMLRMQLESQAAGQAEKRKQILDFVARFGASATKARQAQSRLKSLARMENIEIKPLPVTTTIRIPTPMKTGKLSLALKEASFGYGDKVILKNISLQVERGDHVAVVGLNGAGKSTLLKGISGKLQPITGKCELGIGVEIALFAQHVIEALSSGDTVYSSLESAAHREVRPQEILDLAGSLLFSGDDVKKKISVLSGGEKSRVALGRVLLQKASCLVLDEPTNHLDFQTVEALTNALNAYSGTVIVVSHDRGFIKRVGTKILEVSSGKVRIYPGTYEEYVWSVQQGMRLEGEVSVSHEPEKKDLKNNPVPKENWKDAKKKMERELRHCEKRIQDIEQELPRLEAETLELNQKINDNPNQENIAALGIASKKIQELESVWLELSKERERIQQELLAHTN